MSNTHSAHINASGNAELRDWQDVIDEPFTALAPIDETFVANLRKYMTRVRGAVRLRAGRVLTDDTREERRRRAHEFLYQSDK